MDDEDLSRRLFIIRSLAGVGAGWLLANLPSITAAQEHVHKMLESDGDPKLEFFTPGQAADIDAMASRIIPSDDGTPGAHEALAVYFIDRALSTFDRDKRPLYVKGLKQLNLRARVYGSATFAALPHSKQDMLLKRIEKTKFFDAVRTHTVMGFFCDPGRGGNHNEAGWKLIGFEDSFYYKPPFGYYDAEVANGDE
ncbi:MAG TPA: gluconate 2-dehydrogenase subunit 3 family protein [Blastocatellia bacterium]